MRETRSSGSVRGASGDGRPYRERNLVIAGRSGEGPLTEPTAAARLWEREPLTLSANTRRNAPGWLR